MTLPENVNKRVMLLPNYTKTHHQTNASKLAPPLQTCTMTHSQWHANKNAQMDGSPTMEQEDASNYVHQLLLFMPTLIHSDVLINVPKRDTSSLQILRGLVGHIVLLQTSVICMRIIRRGLVSVCVRRSRACTVSSIRMMRQLERVSTLVRWSMGLFTTLLITSLKAVC